MGLDMYLYASKYESRSKWREEDKKERFYPKELKELTEKQWEHNFLSKDTNYQIGYWRKFNALHHYIVENFADGEDDCRLIYLYRERIEQILQVLKTIKQDKSRANELLPTQSGFFFGSTDYDEWYWEDVEYSIELFETVLKLPKEYSIYYQASW